MSVLQVSGPRTLPSRPRGTARAIGRWMVSFAGYSLGGYAAFLLIGRVDGPGAALAGGLLTGAILGSIQAWAMGPARPRPWPGSSPPPSG